MDTLQNTEKPIASTPDQTSNTSTTPAVPMVALPNTVPPTATEQKKDDGISLEQANAKYAEALINMVNVNYDKQHPEQVKRSKFLTPKQIIFFGILVVITILGTIIFNGFNKSSSSEKATNGNTTKSKQLLHSVETFNNPKDY
jgi:hypothetical protein